MISLKKKNNLLVRKTCSFWVGAFLVCAFVFLFGLNRVNSAINKQISYQGKLTNGSNVAVSDGSYNMRFQLCTASDCSGGSDPIWTETNCYSPDGGSTCDGTGSDQRIAVANGIFSTLLGAVSSLDAIDFDQTLYLRVQVGGSGTTPSWETLSPSKLLGAVPTAITTDLFDGVDSTSFLRSDEVDTMSASSSSTLLTLDQDGTGDILNIIDGSSEVFTILDGGNVGIGTAGPDRKLDVLDASNPQLRLTHTDGSVYADFQTDSSGRLNITPSGSQVLVVSGSVGTPGLAFQSDPDSGFYSIGANRFAISAGGSFIGEFRNDTIRHLRLYGNTYTGVNSDLLRLNTTTGDIFASHGVDETNKRYHIEAWENGVGYDVPIVLNQLGGNVGIGTIPTSPLHVVQAGNGETGLKLQAKSGGLGVVTFDLNALTQLWSMRVQGNAGNNFIIYDTTNNLSKLIISPGATGNTILNNFGKFGIGTAGPDRKLDVLDASNPQLRLTHTDGSVYADFQANSSGYLDILSSGAKTNFYDSAGTNYLTIEHNGTNGVISTNSGEVQIGSSGDFITDSGVNVGLGTDTTNELLTVNGRMSLAETTAPTQTAGYGKVYVKSSDSKLYFLTSGGAEYDLTAGGGGSGVVNTGTAGHLTFYSSTGTTVDDVDNLYWDDATDDLAVGGTSVNETLTVHGVTSLAETTAPTQTAGYGKIYVKSSDSKLYFMDDSGNETDLLAGGGSSTFLGLTDTMSSFTAGSILFTSGSAVTEDNSNFFWDNTNKYLGIGINTPSYVLDIDGASGETNLLNIASNGTDILTVTNTQTTITNPVAMTSAGDTSVAYDLYLTNNTAGYIKFNGPGYIQTESAWQNLDLTLSAAGTGQVIVGDNFLVEGSNTGFVSQITNTNTGAAVDGLYIYLTGDGSLTSTNSYVAFGNPTDTTSGHIYASDNSTVTYGTTGGDYAEFYFTQDKSIEAGDVVCIDVSINNAVKKCAGRGDGNVMGIISTAPGFLGMDEERKQGNDNYKMVAMVGQIPTKVIGENGSIRPGDSLTSSSTPGFAMRADAGDPTVGVALESFIPEEVGSQGNVNVMISRRNKSVTVAQIEQEVADRIAQMELEDEIEILLARSSTISRIDQDLLNYSVRLTSVEQSMDELAQSLDLIDDYRQGVDLIGLGFNNLGGKLNDISNKVASIEVGREYESVDVNWYNFDKDKTDYFVSLVNPEISEDGEMRGFYEANGGFSEISLHQEAGLNVSDFELEEDGYLVFDLFLENLNYLNDLHAEIGNQMDIAELEWQLADFPYLVSGWNKVKLKLSQGRITGDIDWENLNYFRVFFSFSDRSEVGLRDIGLELKRQVDLSQFVLDNPLFDEPINVASEEGKREAIAVLAEKVNQLESDYSVSGQALLSDRLDSMETLVANLNGFNELMLSQLTDHESRIANLENQLVAQGLFDSNSNIKIGADGQVIFEDLAAEKLQSTIVVAGEYAIKEVESDDKNNLTGSVSLEKGQVKVFVENERISRRARLIVTPVGDSPVSWIVSRKEAGVGFEITLEKSVDFDVTFDYWIVSADE